MRDNLLNIKTGQAFDLINVWANAVMPGVKVRFHTDYSLGTGHMKYDFEQDKYSLQLGINPLVRSFFHRDRSLTDSQFVKLGVTLFHEWAHYEHQTDLNTPKNILLSDLSKCGNSNYYEDQWPKFPHEIDAEHTGVMSMWAKLEEMCPELAKSLMFEYVTKKSLNFEYPIPCPKSGFYSKDQVTNLFETSFDKTTKEKRSLPHGFLRLDDDIPKLLTDENRNLRPDYEPFFRQLMKAESGEELDHKMGSLVSFLRPEYQKGYKGLDFRELAPIRVFGQDLPESFEEARMRVVNKPNFSSDITCLTTEEKNSLSFTEAVNGLSERANGLVLV